MTSIKLLCCNKCHCLRHPKTFCLPPKCLRGPRFLVPPLLKSCRGVCPWDVIQISYNNWGDYDPGGHKDWNLRLHTKFYLILFAICCLIVSSQYLCDRLSNTTARDMKDVFISDVVEPLFRSNYTNYIDSILSKCNLQERAISVWKWHKFNFETISLHY